MIENILYILFAIIGLGFIIFIHELGHLIVARRNKMKVEAFSIGFGKPLYTWDKWGIKWMICMLPFGGFVKIAGMSSENTKEPADIPDGFYGRGPWATIKVAFAGPFVNFVFAFVAFAILWMMGGRDKTFSEFTHRIGWIDPGSVLYAEGVRPGDVIEKYDGRAFDGFKSLQFSSFMNKETTRIEGYSVDSLTGKKTTFDHTLKTYEDPHGIMKYKTKTIGVFSPASYLIFTHLQDPLFLLNPSMRESGIQPKDRILWANGEVVFSQAHLSSLVNESTVFVTVKRGEHFLQTKIPRVLVDDLNLRKIERAEIGDWQYEIGLKGKIQNLLFIPYVLSPDCIVEASAPLFDPAQASLLETICARSPLYQPLQEGDQIMAVDGIAVHTAADLLQNIQTKKVLLIVQRENALLTPIAWKQADAEFDSFSKEDLSQIISSIGTERVQADVGQLHLLSPVIPKLRSELYASSNAQESYAAIKKKIEAMDDSPERTNALKALEMNEKSYALSLPLEDLTVIYNPNPIQMFQDVMGDTWLTLTNFFKGYLKPKYMSGPVGIIQAVHHSWSIGFREVLFWMAVISLNLGVMNLLPIPILDGGHIAFACLALITGRPLKAKVMERLMLPFIGLLMFFFIYITYQDLYRLFLQILH